MGMWREDVVGFLGWNGGRSYGGGGEVYKKYEAVIG